MIAMGLLHAFFLWDGDFLASYGVIGLLLLYVCRRLSAKTLIVAGILITLLPGSYALMYFHPGALEDVGLARLALTNYLMTSALCQFVFAWGPWKLFGELAYYQLFWCMLGVWTVNLTLSTLWLRHFAFGPIEWLWRSLTYAKIPPMRLRNV
jgi:uncharacterized protein